MSDAERILAIVDELKESFASGNITQEEFAELLDDIKRTEDIDNISDDIVLKGQILTALDIATYLV